MTCQHMNFAAQVNVARLSDKHDAPPSGYMAEVRVQCADCGQKFQFLGLEPGMDTQGARCSLDGLEANIAITPEGSRPNPLQRKALEIAQESQRLINVLVAQQTPLPEASPEPKGQCNDERSCGACFSDQGPCETVKVKQPATQPRSSFLAMAEACGATLTGKPDASEAVTVVFTIDAWHKFDAFMLAQVGAVPHSTFDGVIPAAISRYLRRCSSGGMPKEHVDIVQANVDNAEQLGYFNLAIAEAILGARTAEAKQNGGEDV